MSSYWAVTFLYNFCLSVITFTTFYVFGRWIFGLSYFIETSGLLMAIIMLGWALSQISLANLVQVFISKAKTATIIGYVLAIFITLVGEALAVGIFAMPLIMPLCNNIIDLDLRLYPSISLCRLFYKMAFACSNGSCYQSIYEIDD
jgi:hypothetical protein